MNQKDYKEIAEIIKKNKFRENIGKSVVYGITAEIIPRLADYIKGVEQNNIKYNHPLWLDKEIIKEAEKISKQFLKDCGVKQ